MQRKQILGVFIIFLCLIPFISAQELTTIELYKDTYLPGETVQAEITTSTPERPLATTNIALVDEQKEKISIAPFLIKKAENQYLLYFDLPLSLTEKSYALEVQNLPYIVDNTLKEITTASPFTISEKADVILGISPGFVILKKGETDFDLRVKNSKTTTPITFNATEEIQHVYTTPQLVQEGTKRTFKFSLDPEKVTKTKPSITLTYDEHSYTIPIFIYQEEEITLPHLKEEPAIAFLTDVEAVERTITQQKTLSGPLEFKNNLNSTLNDITISISSITLRDIVTMNTTTISTMEPYGVAAVFFWVNKEKNAAPGVYAGDVIIQAGNTSALLPMTITVQEEEGETEEEALNLKVEEKEEPKAEPPVFIPLNRTPLPEPEEKREIKVGILVIVFILIIAIILFLVFRKKKTMQQKTFNEVIDNMPK